MARWRDADGFEYNSRWMTHDGLDYPVFVMIAPVVHWTLAEAEAPPLGEMYKPTVACSGPEAHLPLAMTREEVFERASGLSIERWQQLATSEASAGVMLSDEGSVARHLWDKVYAFRPI
jgi:hypothetical protein